jgi:hypothetical protein
MSLASRIFAAPGSRKQNSRVSSQEFPRMMTAKIDHLERHSSNLELSFGLKKDRAVKSLSFFKKPVNTNSSHESSSDHSTRLDKGVGLNMGERILFLEFFKSILTVVVLYTPAT